METFPAINCLVGLRPEKNNNDNDNDINNKFLIFLYESIILFNNGGGYIETKTENDEFLDYLKNKIIVETISHMK